MKNQGLATATMAYVFRHAPCGLIVSAIVDNPDHRKEVAKAVAAGIRLGDVVERMPIEDVRKAMFCSCFTKG